MYKPDIQGIALERVAANGGILFLGLARCCSGVSIIDERSEPT